MSNYRTKLKVVEAFQFTRESVRSDAPGPKLPEWAQAVATLEVTEKVRGSERLIVNIRENEMTVWPGDWLVKDAQGEVYVYDDETFRDMYEPVPVMIGG